jgi:hypothetical protein
VLEDPEARVVDIEDDGRVSSSYPSSNWLNDRFNATFVVVLCVPSISVLAVCESGWLSAICSFAFDFLLSQEQPGSRKEGLGVAVRISKVYIGWEGRRQHRSGTKQDSRHRRRALALCGRRSGYRRNG